MRCGDEFVKWFWTGPWLVTCRLDRGHDGEHSEIPAIAGMSRSRSTGEDASH